MRFGVLSRDGDRFRPGGQLSGHQGVWRDLNNYGNTTPNCTSPDYGFFTSSSPSAAETPYYGYLLASVLARPHAVLRAIGTSDPADVLAYESVLPGTGTTPAEAVSHQITLPAESMTILQTS